jgi:hypothetical protein
LDGSNISARHESQTGRSGETSVVGRDVAMLSRIEKSVSPAGAVSTTLTLVTVDAIGG